MFGPKQETRLRWGGSVFDCQHCGTEGLQWKEVESGRWLPFELLANMLHDCPAKAASGISKEDVLRSLRGMGFQLYRPRTSSWHSAYVASNETQTLYFLVGNVGIDFKFYDTKRELKLDQYGKLYTDGGHFVRNYYKDNEVNLNKLTLELASRFVTNSPIEAEFLVGRGVSPLRDRASRSLSPAAREMQEIYEAISVEDGEDAYLGDGVWISSSGKVTDRGR